MEEDNKDKEANPNSVGPAVEKTSKNIDDQLLMVEIRGKEANPNSADLAAEQTIKKGYDQLLMAQIRGKEANPNSEAPAQKVDETPKTPKIPASANAKDDVERNIGSVTQGEINSQVSNTSFDESEDLTPTSPINDGGLYAGMTLFEFMATPPKQKAKRLPEPMVFELPEMSGTSCTGFKLTDALDNISEMEFGSSEDATDTSSELKEVAMKFEAKLIQEEIAPLTKSKVKTTRIKRPVQRTDLHARKQLAQRSRPAVNLPPLPPTKMCTPHAHDALQKEAATTQLKKPMDVPGSTGEQGKGCSNDPHKQIKAVAYPALQLKKPLIVKQGQGSTHATHKPNIMESKGFKNAPDSPSFDLGIDDSPDSPTKEAYEQAVKKAEEEINAKIEHKPEEEWILKHVPGQEKDDLYMKISKYRLFGPTSDISPHIFQSDEVVLTARELANCVPMGKSLDTKVMEAVTYVISQDPSQKKKIMSHWIGMQMMSPDEMYSKTIEKAFTFRAADYEGVVFPIWQELSKDPTVGHWFAVVVNIKLQRIQIIDSLRTEKDAALREFAGKVRGRIITLWKRYTGAQKECQYKTIYMFGVEYIPCSKQFGIHDCGLFTLMAMRLFDGMRLPKLIGFDELKLRNDMLFEWISNPANKMDWRRLLS